MSPVPRPKSVAKCGWRGRYVEQYLAAKRSHQRRRGEEEEVQGEEEVEVEEEEEEEEDMSPIPRPKRLAKCGWDVELATATERSQQLRRSEEVVEEYHTEEEEDMSPIQRPKRLAKCGSDVEPAAAVERSHQRRHSEEVEEYHMEEEEDMTPIPRPKWLAKRGSDVEPAAAAERSHQRRRSEEEVEEYHIDEEEDMSPIPWPKWMAKCGSDVEPAAAVERSHQRRRSKEEVEEYHIEDEEDMSPIPRSKWLAKCGSDVEPAAAVERSHQQRRSEEEVEEYHTEEEEDMSPIPWPKRLAKCGWDVEPAAAVERLHQRRRSEEEVEECHTEEEEDMSPVPRPKRLAKCGGRGRDVEPAVAAERSYQRRRSEEVEEYHTEEEEDMFPVPRPKRLVKCGGGGWDVELAAAVEQSEEEEDMSPVVRPKSLEKCSLHGRDVEPALAAEQSHQQRHGKEEIEEYHEEEKDMTPVLRPKRTAKCGGRDRDVELALAAERSHQRRRIEEDVDFDPDLDEEDEVDEDIDFDPEADEDEDEFVDEEEDEFGAMHARKVTVKNQVKRRSASKRRALKKKKNRGSTVSRRKVTSAKAKKSAPIRRRRKRSVVDDYEEDEDDDDFIVDDEVMVNRHPRKKARTGSGRESEVDPQVSVVGEDTWPDFESETSDFNFVTSDEEPNDIETPVVEPIAVKKGRKRRISGSESSSDSEFLVSDKELEDLRDIDTPKALPIPPTQMRRISVTRNGEDKGKKKEEPEEAGRPICGICLSEEHRTTVQGVLNCCSHYFCFACIMEWSRVESRCPLCKQRFTTITKSSKVDLGLGVRKAVIKVEERDQVYQPTEEEIRRWLDPYENVVCIECNQGGDDSLMLLCDICDSSAHTYCVGLGREVPEGNWYCGGCRLSDEGPSYTRIHHTVGYERQNFRNVDSSSLGFGTAAPSGTFRRPPSVNPHRSFQGIDLNLSPREVPGEIHPAESQVSTDNASTPSGRRATLSGRRQIQRYIQILLTRPRPPSRPEVYHNIAQHSGGVPRTEPNQRNFRSSSEANTSLIISDGIQNQRNGLSFIQAHSNFAPCMSLDGDDFQQIEGVKSNLRNV